MKTQAKFVVLKINKLKSKKGLALGKVAIVFLIVLALALVSYKIWKAAGG